MKMNKAYLKRRSRKSRLTMKMRVIIKVKIHNLRKNNKINCRSRRVMNKRTNNRKNKSNNRIKVIQKSKINKRKLNLILKEEEAGVEVVSVGEEKEAFQ